jgi:hypothetical protein
MRENKGHENEEEAGSDQLLGLAAWRRLVRRRIARLRILPAEPSDWKTKSYKRPPNRRAFAFKGSGAWVAHRK